MIQTCPVTLDVALWLSECTTMNMWSEVPIKSYMRDQYTCHPFQSPPSRKAQYGIDLKREELRLTTKLTE